MKKYSLIIACILLVSIVLLPACSSKDTSRIVAEGDTVQIHYTGTLLDGTIFDSSLDDGEPHEYVIGSGQLIEGLEKGIIGMRIGETKTIPVTSDEAYGPYREELVLTIPRSDFADGVEPEVDMIINSFDENGIPIYAVVTAVSDDYVTIDTNNFLAGMDLIFEIELLDIK